MGEGVGATGNTPGKIIDRRARLQAKPGMEEYIYGKQTGSVDENGFISGTGGTSNNPMHLLAPGSGGTDGMVFPYTPTITYNQTVDYKNFDLTHVNADYYAYAKTQTLQLTVIGQWTAQSVWEARYALGCIHFLRTVTKMRFGIKDLALAGTPPPILLFSAHGDLMFNRIPVVVSSFTVDLMGDVDYVQVAIGGPDDLGQNIQRQQGLIGKTESPSTPAFISTAGRAWIPSRFQISTTLIVQQTPKQWREKFKWTSFRDGTLLERGGWI